MKVHDVGVWSIYGPTPWLRRFEGRGGCGRRWHSCGHRHWSETAAERCAARMVRRFNKGVHECEGWAASG